MRVSSAPLVSPLRIGIRRGEQDGCKQHRVSDLFHTPSTSGFWNAQSARGEVCVHNLMSNRSVVLNAKKERQRLSLQPKPNDDSRVQKLPSVFLVCMFCKMGDRGQKKKDLGIKTCFGSAHASPAGAIIVNFEY